MYRIHTARHTRICRTKVCTRETVILQTPAVFLPLSVFIAKIASLQQSTYIKLKWNEQTKEKKKRDETRRNATRRDERLVAASRKKIKWKKNENGNECKAHRTICECFMVDFIFSDAYSSSFTSTLSTDDFLLLFFFSFFLFSSSSARIPLSMYATTLYVCIQKKENVLNKNNIQRIEQKK